MTLMYIPVQCRCPDKHLAVRYHRWLRAAVAMLNRGGGPFRTTRKQLRTVPAMH